MLNPKVLKILIDNKELYRDEVFKIFQDEIIERYSSENLNKKIKKIKLFNSDLMSILEQNHESTTITHKCVYDILNVSDLNEILNIVYNSWTKRLGIDDIKISTTDCKITKIIGMSHIEKDKFEEIFNDTNLIISNNSNDFSIFDSEIKSHINYDISFNSNLPNIMISYGSKKHEFFDETYNVHNISFITNVLGIKITSNLNNDN